jgi:GT2 family glycosyltransferase
LQPPKADIVETMTDTEAPKGRSVDPRGKVAVVILNWNAAGLTLKCVESVRRSDYGRLEIVVIDNGSKDGSSDAIEARFPGITIVRNPTNVGFAEGSNQGIRCAIRNGAAYILLLNNDTVIDKGMISCLVETAAARKNRVAVSPKMLDGYEPSRLWFVFGKTSLWTGIFSNPAYNAPAETVFHPVISMEYASGCCILMPRELINAVGEFNPRFFAYCEDVEWSLRARRLGFQLLCDTRAELWHYIASTGGKNPSRMRYLMTRNHIWTLRKHATKCQFAVFALVFYPPRCVLRLAKAVMNAQWGCIPAEFRGALDGFFAPLAPAGSPRESRAVRE